MPRPNVIAALLLTACLAAPSHAQAPLGPVINPANGHRYHRLAPASWSTQVARAQALGGALATIGDAAENSWVRSNLAAVGGNTTQCSIGFTDAAVEGTFAWLSGEPVGFTGWGPGEPNNQGNEDAVAMNPLTGLWNDVPVSISLPAIAEVEGDIRVPLEYPTIQAAINAAVDGQTIVVAPGSYVGNVDFLYKKLVVRSEAGPAVTSIRTTDPNFGIILNGNQGPETVLEGFTITPNSPTNILVVLGQGQTIRSCRLAGGGGTNLLLNGRSTASDCLSVGSIYGIATGGAGAVTVQNCTVVGASCGLLVQPPGSGAMILNASNCILKNTLPSSVGAGGAIRFDHCNLPGAAGPGGIDADPMFARAPGPDGVYDLSDDYTLRPGSPCIDAGSNASRAATSAVAAPLDAGWSNRFVDDPASPGAGVDMGAFEFAPAQPILPGCPIDFNNDGFVDFFDYDDFVAAFEHGC